MAPQINFFVDDDDIATADESGSFAFIVPPDAAVKGNLKDPMDDKARATWVQRLEIVDCKWYEDTAKPSQKDAQERKCVCAEIKFQVPPDALRPTGSPDPNAGKSTTQWYRLFHEAQKNKSHPRFGSHNFSLSSLNGILRSIWGTEVFPHGQKHNLGNFFGTTPPAVTGKFVVCMVNGSRYEGKRKDELRDWVPLELQV